MMTSTRVILDSDELTVKGETSLNGHQPAYIWKQ